MDKKIIYYDNCNNKIDKTKEDLRCFEKKLIRPSELRQKITFIAYFIYIFSIEGLICSFRDTYI